MLHGIAAAFLRPGGPYLNLRLVTAAYALSAIGRLIPVKRKQVPGPGDSPGTGNPPPSRPASQGRPARQPLRAATSPPPLRPRSPCTVSEVSDTVFNQPPAASAEGNPDLTVSPSGWREPSAAKAP